MSVESENIKILLAEDALAMRKIEIKLLRSLGFTNVVEANDGNEAIRILKDSKDINLVISDWNMPNKSGLELLEWIRADADYSDIPFIMATAQSDKKQEHLALEKDASCLVAKPFSPEELKAKIDLAMGVVQQTGPAAEDIGPQMAASGKVRLRIAHIQITDHIILGVLKDRIKSGMVSPQHFELETTCKPSWNPVSQALEEGTIDGAFVLAPIAMDLFNFGAPIKLVLMAHKSGSIMVRSKQGEYKDPFQDFFRGRSFLIPHKMSIHHMLVHMFFNRIGLNASLEKDDDVDVNLEVVAPVRMPGFLKENSNNCGFLVAEPIGTKSIAAGISDLQFLSSELWPNHPCCVVAMRDEAINAHPEAIAEFTQLLVQAGKFVESNPAAAADIAVRFLDPDGKLGLKVPILKNVLTEPKGIKTGDLYPVKEDLEKIQQYMVNTMHVGALIDLDRFVDLRFADAACPARPAGAEKSGFTDSASVAMGLLTRCVLKGGSVSKSMLNKEGKYLTFGLNDQEFGIDILRVKEIIGTMEINALPQVHKFVKGVINLRDRVIPVMDLRLRFGMEEIEPTERSCIIILENMHTPKNRSNLVGITVDGVSEVLTVNSEDIDDAPTFTASVDTNYILAMAKIDQTVKILLNIDKVLEFRSEPEHTEEQPEEQSEAA